MAQRLRVLPVIAEDRGSLPSTHMEAHSNLQLQLRGPKVLSCLSQESGMCVVHRHICGPSTHTLKYF